MESLKRRWAAHLVVLPPELFGRKGAEGVHGHHVVQIVCECLVPATSRPICKDPCTGRGMHMYTRCACMCLMHDKQVIAFKLHKTLVQIINVMMVMWS